MTEIQIQEALAKFEALIREQDARSEAIKQQGDFVDFANLEKLTIGVCGGDGIGPIITNEAARVLEFLLKSCKLLSISVGRSILLCILACNLFGCLHSAMVQV